MVEAKSCQPAIIITGMHRSGTSLMASLLQSTGIHIGSRLMDAGLGNAKGHFEDLDFVEFHEEVLKSQGISKQGWTLNKQIKVQEQYIDTAKTIINKRCKLNEIWGWKDPRTTLFLDFWISLIPNSYFILLYRSPWEVIDSLYRRGDEAFLKNPNFALQVWSSYNQAILDFIERFPNQCCLFNLDSIIQNPEYFIEVVTTKFNLSLTSPKYLYEQSLISHDVSNSHRPSIINQYFPGVSQIYQALYLKEAQTNQVLNILQPQSENNIDYKAWALQDWLDVRQAQAKMDKVQRQLEKTQIELEATQEEIKALNHKLNEIHNHWQNTLQNFEQYKHYIKTRNIIYRIKNHRMWKTWNLW